MLILRTNGRHWFTLLRLHHISGGERLCLKSYWSGSSAFTLTGLHKQLSSKQSWTSNCGSCKIILDPAIYILMCILQITANVIHGTSGGAADCLELGCKMQWDASIFCLLGLLLLSSPIPSIRKAVYIRLTAKTETYTWRTFSLDVKFVADKFTGALPMVRILQTLSLPFN